MKDEGAAEGAFIRRTRTFGATFRSARGVFQVAQVLWHGLDGRVACIATVESSYIMRRFGQGS